MAPSVGLHHPYSSGFTPALVVRVRTGLVRRHLQPLQLVIVSEVERCIVQMVSIRAPVSDARCDGHRGRSERSGAIMRNFR